MRFSWEVAEVSKEQVEFLGTENVISTFKGARH
jgi:hypothetical protein